MIHIADILFDLSAIDGFALTITIVGYSVVFLALAFMYYVFTMLPKIINLNIRQKLRRQGKHEEAAGESIDVPGEVNAAISMALHLYFSELHDEESNVMTIKRVSKRYSPWSSKIYGLNTYTRR
ncbi:MAG: OadG family protein [Bacteroidales bacterium]|jgi:Na+-transporting methylmalonyl-CoA/oxaloacetate decarboxylase gamma subunit|nr:OadG family protein [Bacteroidales bacterium]HPK04520.1 OadG family protein [Bacteroidales bacterium]